MSEQVPISVRRDCSADSGEASNLYVLTPVALGITGVSALRGAVGVLSRRRWLVASVLLAFIVAGVAYAALATPTYRAEVTMAPASLDSESGLGGVVSQFGSIAALAGFSGLTGSNAQEAVAVLESRSFTAEFIRKRKLLPVLFSDDWDAREERWVVPEEEIPTVADGVQLFDDSIRSVAIDLDTGLVTLGIEWRDPDVAAEWANGLTTEVNRTLRDREMREATRSLGYLHKQIEQSSMVEIRGALFKLVEEQEKRKMLAAVNDQYAFRVLDEAVAPERDAPVRPRALLILVTAVLIGLLFGFGAAMLAELAVGDGGRVVGRNS